MLPAYEFDLLTPRGAGSFHRECPPDSSEGVTIVGGEGAVRAFVREEVVVGVGEWSLSCCLYRAGGREGGEGGGRGEGGRGGEREGGRGGRERGRGGGEGERKVFRS